MISSPIFAKIEVLFVVFVGMKIVLLVLSVLLFFANPLLSLFFLLLLAWYQTNETQRSPLQQQFLAGTVPAPAPEGFCKGSTDFYHASWQGKKFDPANSRGVNIFIKHGGMVELYPFKTYVAKGLRDTATEVFKIDYQLSEAPWYARPILDEVVQVSPGKYLGKIHYRLIPWFPFTIGYFWLEK